MMIERNAIITDTEAGLRLDLAVGRLFSEFSRARLQRWIRDGALLLNDAQARNRDKVAIGDTVTLRALADIPEGVSASGIPLDIVHEDEELLIVNKPVGLVVHPAAGHRDDTLVNGLLNYCPALGALPRAGIVHRLDKDTSGLLVVAKRLSSHKILVDALQARAVYREYQALVNGVLVSGGEIDKRLGRHPRNRQKMAVVERGGKAARTRYRVRERFLDHTLLTVTLDTGRTHQIRVHMAWIGHAIVGDRVYAGRQRRPAGASKELLDSLQRLRHQALHAWRLQLVHPASGVSCRFEAPLPADMTELLALLRNHTRGQG